MNDLPTPSVLQASTPQGDLPSPASVGLDTPTPVPAGASNDSDAAKVLLVRASEQIDLAIAETTATPVERAKKLHDIKTAYLKNRYGVELHG